MYRVVNNVPISCHMCDRLGCLIEMLNEQRTPIFRLFTSDISVE